MHETTNQIAALYNADVWELSTGVQNWVFKAVEDYIWLINHSLSSACAVERRHHVLLLY